MAARKGEGAIWKIIELLERHPEGLTSGEIRAKLHLAPEEQVHLDRRRRQVRRHYELIKDYKNGKWTYRLGEKRDKPILDRNVNQRVRAAVLARAYGRCQMCGRSIKTHGVTLVVDHKIPVEWNGPNDEHNLWALCEDCNQGKKAYFASHDQSVMRDVMGIRSVHMRIGELLKRSANKPVPSSLLELVANQEDWRKRTRELRDLGWKIEASRKRLPSGKVESYYTLRHFTAWPDDPTSWIRRFERQRSSK